MSPAAKKTKKPAVKTTTHHKKTKIKKTTKKPGFTPYIEKVTVNIGVGESGEKLAKAQTVLTGIAKQKPVQTISKTTSKDWGLREGMPIGCKVTLRGKKAHDLIVEALKTRDNKISDYSFDGQGNFSFGIPDHTSLKDQKYDPNIGIFGMDISVTMQKPGYRIRRRRIDQRKIRQSQHITEEETKEYLIKEFHVEVVE